MPDDTLYRIKPLVWEKRNPERAVGLELTYLVYSELYMSGPVFWWRISGIGDSHRCRSEQEAKAAAEAHHRARLLAALEPVSQP